MQTAYNWNIKPSDRSWIISQDGKIKGGINHRAILKKYHLINDNQND